MIRFLIAVLAAIASPVFAHGDATHAKKASLPISTDEHEFGREGDPQKAKRTITVGMFDKFRFSPADIAVKRGETLKFQVTNNGELQHEMVIGTMEKLKEHSTMMMKHPEMEHAEPFMAHVAPSKSGTLVWQFTKAGTFYFGCLVPGHFEAGMIGKIVVKP